MIEMSAPVRSKEIVPSSEPSLKILPVYTHPYSGYKRDKRLQVTCAYCGLAK